MPNLCWTFIKKEIHPMTDNQTASKTEQPPKIAIDQVTLSIIVPIYNEELVLPEFHRRLTAVLDKNNINAEINYINDGSKDRTKSIILALRKNDPRVALID